MSNVKKCLILSESKKQNRDYFHKKAPAFLLLEFVMTLGITVLSITSMGLLLHSITQTQQATLCRSQLINGVMTSGENHTLPTSRVVHQYEAQLIFDAAAHEAWRQRWKGRSLLPVEPFKLEMCEVELRRGQASISMRCMKGVQ